MNTPVCTNLSFVTVNEICCFFSFSIATRNLFHKRSKIHCENIGLVQHYPLQYDFLATAVVKSGGGSKSDD